MGFLHSFHHWCCRHSLTYHRWHNHPFHPHAHWGFLSACVIAVGLWIGALGWRDVGYHSAVFVPRAVYAQTSGFDARKAAWIASDPFDTNLWAGRQHVLAWVEAGTHGSCRSQSQLASVFNSGTPCTKDAEGTCRVYIDSSNRVEKMLDGSYNDLDCIAGNIPMMIEWAMDSGSFTPAVLARLHYQYSFSDSRLQQFFNNLAGDSNFFDASPRDSGGSVDMQPIKTAVHYLAAMRSKGTQVVYGDRGPSFSAPFTYNGVTYVPGGTYNAYELTRDWMYKLMEQIIMQPNYETNSRSYNSRAISAAQLLYDFGEPEMKLRAKMFLDFLFLDAGAQFSRNVNQWGGLLGRTYRIAYVGGDDTMPWYVYWGMGPRNSMEGQFYVSGYRLSPLVAVFPEVNDGGWMLKRDYYRNNVFTTNTFSIAAGFDGDAWRITVRGSDGDGTPFDFWINDFAGDLDLSACSQAGNTVGSRIVSTCGGSECYSCLGGNGYLYRNNIFFENLSTPTFHFTSWRQSFDQGTLQPTDAGFGNEYFLSNNQWNYFLEGNTAIAVFPGPGSGAVEVARIDPLCSEDFCYPSFSDFTSRSRSVGVSSFTNGKGVVVSTTNAYSRPSQRLIVETNDSTRYVSWVNNVMEVANGGTCRYDFNTWTTTPAGCEGEGGPMGGGHPVCPDGICNGSETPQSCPADCDSAPPPPPLPPSSPPSPPGGAPFKPILCYCPNSVCPAQCSGNTGGPLCGQNGCEPGETAQSCPVDCGGSPSGPTCNDNRVCDPGETYVQCPNDCPAAQSECSDGLDNDGDGKIDFGAGSSNDPGCSSASDTSELDAVISQCNNGIDDDSDGKTDYPADPGCTSTSDVNETDPTNAGADFNIPFPRISYTAWGGSVIDWFARFDLIDNFDPFGGTEVANTAYPIQIKALNPHARVIVSRDFNQGLAGVLLRKPQYDAWKLRNSRGQVCGLYFADDALYDITNFAPSIPTEYGTVKYNEYVALYMTDPAHISLGAVTPNMDQFDGVMTDGLWNSYVDTGQACSGDIDIDRNGVNDFSEHGEAWINQQFEQGATVLLSSLRARLDAINPQLLLIINSGGPHEWDMQYQNGFLHEDFNGHWGFNYTKGVYDHWNQNSAKPTAIVVNMDTANGSTVSPQRNDLQMMRYGLTFALLEGAFFDFTDYERAFEHYWVAYFDEYDLDLGFPTGPAQKVGLKEAWARFFDRGVAVHNSSDSASVVITESDLRALDGYDGPYYRFEGGQDLALNGVNAMNNGQQLTDSNPLLLRNRRPLINGVQTVIADGAILVFQPQTVVSDIIIDNWASGTSPGSLSPGDEFEPGANLALTFPGFTQASDCESGTNYYTVRCAIFNPPDRAMHSPPYATAPPGSAKAVYTPNIGVAGKYEVYEWHGSIPGLASKVIYQVNGATPVDGSCTNCVVNQSVNSGTWNRLGMYIFSVGTSGNVTILASGADGTVMADAMKFVYRGP